MECSQENVKFKKRLIEQMDSMDKQFNESVQSLLKSLTESINGEFYFFEDDVHDSTALNVQDHTLLCLSQCTFIICLTIDQLVVKLEVQLSRRQWT